MLFTKLNAFILSIVLFCFITMAHADYIEGIDTTDVNGYGLDSTIQVFSYGKISNLFAFYGFFVPGSRGYFNYSFEDIKIAPDTVRQSQGIGSGQVYYCFILKNIKDSTYCKIQILQKLSDTRYVFKYGKNTIPNDRLLDKSDYDRTIRYKPNNLYNICGPYPQPSLTDTTFWDPPLPNNNHLLGYIFYRSKNGISIDTTAPINLAEWDSIAYCTSTKFFNPTLCQGSGYFNIIAVYSEGKSDFLNGWTRSIYSLVKTKDIFSFSRQNIKTIQIQKSLSNIVFLLPYLNLGKSATSFSIFNISGCRIARFSEIASDRIIWHAPKGVFNTGVYIAKAQLSDKSTISRTFMITR